MRSSSRCGLAALVLGLLLAWSPAVRAERDHEGIDLRYEPPEGCPAREELRRAIHDRSPHGFPSADDRSFRVRIEQADGDYHGRLEIERQGRTLSVREIRGPTCDVVSTAIAVFVAIALDPAELAADVEPPSTSPPAAPAPEVPRDASPRSPTAGSVALPSPRWHLGTGMNAGAVLHPSAAWGGRVHAEITRLAAGAFLAPELRLSWGWSEFAESPPRGGEASFRFQTARAEACALHERAPLVASACGGFEAGRLSATTRNLPRAGGTSEAWYAPTAIVRPGWFLVDWLSLEAELGVLVPLTQASFVLAEPERTVYRIPRVAFTATAGFRIWARLP
ncbi:MAG: hypothetical protein KF894_19955 [Labilithrix sp.]|nr:hypothetical protein [Labilithrix sp.]